MSRLKGALVTTSTTSRSIEIDAPVERVFAFVSDLEALMGSVPSIRSVAINAVDSTEDRATNTYTWTTTIGIGPLRHEVHGATTREQLVPNQRVVYKHAMGLRTVETLTLEPAETGTRLNFTVSVTSPVPLLDKLGVLVSSGGKGHAHYVDQVLAEIKRELEASRDGPPADPISTS